MTEKRPGCEKPDCLLTKIAEEVCPVDDCDAATTADCERSDCPVEPAKDCSVSDCPVK